MISSDFRTEARRKLSGKWGKIVLVTLLYALIAGLLGTIEQNTAQSNISFVISIAVLIVEVPLAFGYGFTLYKAFKGEELKYLDFFFLGFNNFTKSWGIVLHTLVKMILPLLAMIISIVLIAVGAANVPTITSHYETEFASIVVSNVEYMTPLIIIGFIGLFVSSIWFCIRSFLYTLANYIAYDNLEMPAKDAVEKSQSLMNGNRGKYFALLLTFIGWIILAFATFGIGFLWLVPYIQFAVFVFYRYLVDGKKEETTETTSDNT